MIFGRHDLIQDAPISRARPARLPQHADVLQRRGAGPDPGALPLRRSAGRRLPVPRQGRDAARPRQQLHGRWTCKRRIFQRTADEQPARPAAGAQLRRPGDDTATGARPGRVCARRPSTPARWRRSSSTAGATWSLANERARALFDLAAERPRAGRSRTWRSPTGPLELRSLHRRRPCASAGPVDRQGRRVAACRAASRACFDVQIVPLLDGRRPRSWAPASRSST